VRDVSDGRGLDLTANGVTMLHDHVAAMPGPRFAVLDGALYADLPGELTDRSVAAISLFRDHPDHDVENAGPWMVSLDVPEAINEVLELSLGANQASGVFWSCPGGEAVLLQHLRTINMVLLPSPDLGSHRAVMFRHWDPNVLAMVLGVLDKAQLREFIGPAETLVFDAPDFGGFFRCVAGKEREGKADG
jgi:Domain of unknown function (DUF4123)